MTKVTVLCVAGIAACLSACGSGKPEAEVRFPGEDIAPAQADMNRAAGEGIVYARNVNRMLGTSNRDCYVYMDRGNDDGETCADTFREFAAASTFAPARCEIDANAKIVAEAVGEPVVCDGTVDTPSGNGDIEIAFYKTANGRVIGDVLKSDDWTDY